MFYIEKLRHQHIKDLELYQLSHGEWRNRWIHYFMIPIECFAFQLACTLIGLRWIGYGQSVLSIQISTRPSLTWSSGLYHIFSVWIAHHMVTVLSAYSVMLIALILWCFAWTVQVGLGHWICERNQPNVANIAEVSYLAMLTSTLIAWSSWWHSDMKSYQHGRTRNNHNWMSSGKKELMLIRWI